jgi:hypothetical protein
MTLEQAEEIDSRAADLYRQTERAFTNMPVDEVGQPIMR